MLPAWLIPVGIAQALVDIAKMTYKNTVRRLNIMIINSGCSDKRELYSSNNILKKIGKTFRSINDTITISKTKKATFFVPKKVAVHVFSD
ncbi:hypothetical protein GCM10009410_22140 [Shewanella ulleungensis]|uniref:Uncharacterized protein n=1 Tax=Shewanella ulleungensis TaxID=2282699 RepID=A0ABQ2QPP9_9GAMM|nr:hypothetical protein GCM10009410_22140 [Shewanella ulleungensis]